MSIETCNIISYLGVTFDGSINWKIHVNKLRFDFDSKKILLYSLSLINCVQFCPLLVVTNHLFLPCYLALGRDLLDDITSLNASLEETC